MDHRRTVWEAVTPGKHRDGETMRRMAGRPGAF
jgi:hypothetical protein